MNELKERYEQLQAARSRAWRAGDDFDEALIEAEIASLIKVRPTPRGVTAHPARSGDAPPRRERARL
jgi:hypothetical protein